MALLNKLILVGLLALILSACQSSKRKVVNQLNINKLPKELYIDLGDFSDVGVKRVDLGYDGTQLAMSAHQANINAVGAGGSAAAGLVGGLIGIAIAKSSADSSAQKERNKPVLGLIKKLNGSDEQAILQQSTLCKLKHCTFKAIKNQEVTLTPSISITKNYRSLALSVKVEFRKGKKVVYRNFINIESKPLLSLNSTLNKLNNVPDDDLDTAIINLFSKFDEVLNSELLEWRKLPKKNKRIKYLFEYREYYDRGSVLAQTGTILTYRDLRGQIRVVNIEKML